MDWVESENECPWCGGHRWQPYNPELEPITIEEIEDDDWPSLIIDDQNATGMDECLDCGIVIYVP